MKRKDEFAQVYYSSDQTFMYDQMNLKYEYSKTGKKGVVVGGLASEFAQGYYSSDQTFMYV